MLRPPPDTNSGVVDSFPAFLPRLSRSERAATLLEILLVAALVLVLACLTVVGFAHWKKSSQNVVCAANLRQVGLAVMHYAQENNNQLPGPLWRGQTPYYQTDAEGLPDTASGNLISFLAVYLDLEALPPVQTARADPISCPAWLADAEKAGKTMCYYSTGLWTKPNGEEVTPFGIMGTAEREAVPPLVLAALETPSQIPALREFDRRGVTEGFYSEDPRVPEAPVHQTVRHVLYFDSHVAAVSVN